MGTRSLTRVFELDAGTREELLTIYRQFDGYPSGLGLEIAGFLGSGDRRFNGPGCLAAALVWHLKRSSTNGDPAPETFHTGNVYIHAPRYNAGDCGAEWEYHVVVSPRSGITLIVHVVRRSDDQLVEVWRGRPIELTKEVARQLQAQA